MAVRHLAHVRARTADDRDIARIGLVSLRQSIHQSGCRRVFAVASLPVDRRSRIPSTFVIERQGVSCVAKSSKRLFQRIIRHTANRGHASRRRCTRRNRAVRVHGAAFPKVLFDAVLESRGECTARDSQAVIRNVRNICIHQCCDSTGNCTAGNCCRGIGSLIRSIYISRAIFSRLQFHSAASNTYIAVFRIAIYHANLNDLRESIFAANLKDAVRNYYVAIFLFATIAENKNTDNIVIIAVGIKINSNVKFAARHIQCGVLIDMNRFELFATSGCSNLTTIDVDNCVASRSIRMNCRIHRSLNVDFNITIEVQRRSRRCICIVNINAVAISGAAFKNILASAAACERQRCILDNNAVAVAYRNSQRIGVYVKRNVLVADCQRSSQLDIVQQCYRSAARSRLNCSVE